VVGGGVCPPAAWGSVRSKLAYSTRVLAPMNRNLQGHAATGGSCISASTVFIFKLRQTAATRKLRHAGSALGAAPRHPPCQRGAPLAHVRCTHALRTHAAGEIKRASASAHDSRRPAGLDHGVHHLERLRGRKRMMIIMRRKRAGFRRAALRSRSCDRNARTAIPQLPPAPA
jgi:hypothetical protein